MTIDAAIGDNLYCPKEGWSGEVVEIIDDDFTGEPAMAVLKSHDPTDRSPWICLSLMAYDAGDIRGFN